MENNDEETVCLVAMPAPPFPRKAQNLLLLQELLLFSSQEENRPTGFVASRQSSAWQRLANHTATCFLELCHHPNKAHIFEVLKTASSISSQTVQTIEIFACIVIKEQDSLTE